MRYKRRLKIFLEKFSLISAIIENGIVNRKSFLIEKDVDNPVIHDSISFFSKHAEIVENGTISKALKNLLISGENI